jgi:hypothetical protein
MPTLSMLERRRIEAEMLKRVYDVLSEEQGRETAERILGEVVARAAVAQGESFRASLGKTPDLQDFAAILPLWTMEDALSIELLEEGRDKLDFNVTRCRYAEMYHGMGLGEIGHLLSCNRDGLFCTGYNPDIELTRTQTIMQGASHCDFRYRLKSEAEEPSLP